MGVLRRSLLLLDREAYPLFAALSCSEIARRQRQLGRGSGASLTDPPRPCACARARAHAFPLRPSLEAQLLKLRAVLSGEPGHQHYLKVYLYLPKVDRSLHATAPNRVPGARQDHDDKVDMPKCALLSHTGAELQCRFGERSARFIPRSHPWIPAIFESRWEAITGASLAKLPQLSKHQKTAPIPRSSLCQE